jgi:2-polyprenyl-3-methyl-5-hydroxy-6-metoxy-1,4-benzoquinol methylase
LLLRDTAIKAHNVYIADIREVEVERGRRKFGFQPVTVPESGRLPFDDKFFDIVYCSSVIEHVTLPKALVWATRNGRAFKSQAWNRQQEFAREIRRLGRHYFVQTPNKYFPLESHTWLPFVGYLPRPILLQILAVTNSFWVKKTSPDWSLLSASEMQRLFPDSQIVVERSLGLAKSIMAIRK